MLLVTFWEKIDLLRATLVCFSFIAALLWSIHIYFVFLAWHLLPVQMKFDLEKVVP